MLAASNQAPAMTPLAPALLLLAVLPVAARAQSVSVFGAGQLAEACSLAARAGRPSERAVELCGRSIDSEPLSVRELAGTYVNRGVLRLLAGQYPAAEADFDQAVANEPAMGESYVNRGAALIAQRRFQAGVADLNRGLALHPQEPEKAYYNRALARERLGDLRGAYADYRTAASLKPGWPAPVAELARFTVTPRPAGELRPAYFAALRLDRRAIRRPPT